MAKNDLTKIDNQLEVKMELGLIKEEEKEQRLAAKKNREEGSLPAENQS